MRALVISGGGCKGAFAGGIAEFLIKECKHQYDLLLGTSTGSLLIPLLSIGETERLRAVFTSVTQKDIFNNCPLRIRKKNGTFTTSINHIGIVRMFLKGKKTLGESKSLRELISEIITPGDFARMKLLKGDIVVTLSNLSTNEVEYKSLKDCDYDDFCDWMWASANVVPFMSLVEKNGYEYADGGMGNIVPIYEAMQRGACEIDIILLNAENKIQPRPPVRNALEVTSRVFDFMLTQIVRDDVIIGKYEGNYKEIKLNFYQPKETLTNNALIFDPEQMTAWWEEGFAFARDIGPSCRNINMH